MKYKKILSLILAGAMMLSFVACSGSNKNNSQTSGQSNQQVEQEKTEDTPKNITITHNLGTVEVPYDPEKIAVLELSVLDMVDALELGERVVGIPKSSSVSYLISYIDDENIVNTGSPKEIDMEALMASEPDVIFIGGRLEAEYENLSKIAPVVYVGIDRDVEYINSFSSNLSTVASIFGLEEKGFEISNSFYERIKALKEVSEGKSAIISLVTSGSVNTLGDGSRCSMITNEIGFTNIASDVNSTHGDTASFELLLDKNPEYIFVLDRDTAINSEGAKTAKEVIENELVMKTDAYKNGNIVYLTPDVWYLSEGGITATDMMLKDLENALIK